jgi:hypothetical protein
MDTKPKLAVFGILLVFGMVVSSQVYGPTFDGQSLGGAGAAAFPDNAPAFLDPSVLPPTPTEPPRRFKRTPPIVITLPRRITVETTPPPIITNTPIIPTPTDTDPFQPSDTPVPPVMPTNPEQFVQPELSTPMPLPTDTLVLPTDTLPPESAAPSETPVPGQTPTFTKPPETISTRTVTQPANIPTVVSPVSTIVPGGDSPLFTTAQLQIAGIAAFVIVDLVFLVIILRNWNRAGRRAR